MEPSDRDPFASAAPAAAAAGGQGVAQQVAVSHAEDGSPGQFDGTVEVLISEPLKRGDGINSYMIYTVATKVTSSDGITRTYETLRRYNDFVWLHQKLFTAYPGMCVCVCVCMCV